MSVHEFLSFASIVERESLFEDDRPMIAGVFKNRLDQNMALQRDIKVNYAMDKTGVNVSIADPPVSYTHLQHQRNAGPAGGAGAFL